MSDTNNAVGSASPAADLRTIDDLDLSNRAYNCLMAVGINGVEQLTRYSAADLLSIRSFGVGTLAEIESAIAPAALAKPLRNGTRALPVAHSRLEWSPERLFLMRAARHLSQEALAEMIGTGHDAVGQWERGYGSPTATLLLRLLLALGCEPDELCQP